MRKRIGGMALVLALAFGAQGCYGKFALTKRLHKWNGSLGDKFVNELVFLVIGVVLPVYGIAALVDAVVINSIEFWSGKNPVASKVVTQGDKMMAMDFDQSTGLVKVSYFEQGQLKSQGYLRKTGDKVEMLDAAGKSVQAVATVNSHGEPVLADASGLVLAETVQR